MRYVTNILLGAMIQNHSIGEHREIVSRGMLAASERAAPVHGIADDKIPIQENPSAWRRKDARLRSVILESVQGRGVHRRGGQGRCRISPHEECQERNANPPRVQWGVIVRSGWAPSHERSSESSRLESENWSVSTPTR